LLFFVYTGAIRRRQLTRRVSTPPKLERTSKRVLTGKELDNFMDTIKADPFWHDFFYTELTKVIFARCGGSEKYHSHPAHLPWPAYPFKIFL